MTTYTTGDVGSIAFTAVQRIADADHSNGRLTKAGADYIASLFTAMPQGLRQHVYYGMDSCPGEFNYRDMQGREWHWLLRQWRNYYQQSFQQTMKGE